MDKLFTERQNWKNICMYLVTCSKQRTALWVILYWCKIPIHHFHWLSVALLYSLLSKCSVYCLIVALLHCLLSDVLTNHGIIASVTVALFVALPVITLRYTLQKTLNRGVLFNVMHQHQSKTNSSLHNSKAIMLFWFWDGNQTLRTHFDVPASARARQVCCGPVAHHISELFFTIQRTLLKFLCFDLDSESGCCTHVYAHVYDVCQSSHC